MSSQTPVDPGSIKADFIRVIQSFSNYLSLRKESNILFPKISAKSETLIRNWGKDFPAMSSFYFTGPENSSVFLVDSKASFFKGETGQLLSRIIAAMGLSSDAVFICNSDVPLAVKDKIKKILPKVIITFGEEASQAVLGPGFRLNEQGGKFHEFTGIKVMPTLHPSLLLDQPHFKRRVWEDMKLVMEYAGLKSGS
jgi:Uracil DNA glycosylase superfamily